MAPAAPELPLLGLMHFALARLDFWHWKVLKMLLQNSDILIAAAFLPSTTTGLAQPGWTAPAAGWISRKVLGDWNLLAAGLLFALLTFACLTSGCTKRADALTGHLLDQGWVYGVPIPAWELEAWPMKAGSLPSQVIVGGYWATSITVNIQTRNYICKWICSALAK